MFDPISIGLTALSAGGKLLSGIGAAQASAKTARLQEIADAKAQQHNDSLMYARNARAEDLGREALRIPHIVESGGWVDVDGLVAAAERAGFNPVTFLNGGGLSAYTNRWERETGHNTADLYKLMMPDYWTQQASQVPAQQSMLSAVGGALSAGADTFGTQYRANQSYDLQMQRLELANQERGFGLSQGNGLMTAISYGTSGVGASGGSAAKDAPGALSAYPYPDMWKPDGVKVTNPHYGAFIDETHSGGDAYTKRYAEPGEWLFGIDTMVHDAVRNLTGRTIRDWGFAAGMNIGAYKEKGDTSWAPAFGRWWSSPSSLPNTWLRNPATQESVTPYMPFPGAAAWQ